MIEFRTRGGGLDQEGGLSGVPPSLETRRREALDTGNVGRREEKEVMGKGEGEGRSPSSDQCY